MAPNVQRGFSLGASDGETPPGPPPVPPMKIVWWNVYWYVVIHSLAVWGLYRACTVTQLATILWALLWYVAGGIGVTAGAHRLFSHRAYKANLPLRVILMLLFTVAGQNDIYEWSRDHRLHHHSSETDSDPHNALRGFFFAHMGWLMVRKHPEVLREGRKMDFSDLQADPVVQFNKRFYYPLALLMVLVIPTAVPCLLWHEAWLTSLLVCGVLKYVVTLHCTWLVNSAAHMFGHRSYDASINPRENLGVSLLAVGEGFHNYHHVFPWDYKAGELPGGVFNITTLFIDFFARLGWVYDRKVVTQEMIERRAARMGDGTRKPRVQ